MRAFLGSIVAVSLISSPVLAFDNNSDLGAFDEFSNKARGYAGLYLNINLSRTSQSRNKLLSYGFRAGLQQQSDTADWSTRLQQRHGSLQYRNAGMKSQYGPQQTRNIDVFNINFNENGLQKTQMMGAVMYAADGTETFWDQVAKADGEDDGDKEGVTAGKVALWGLAGVGALVLIGAVAFAASADDEFLFGDDGFN